MHSVDELLQAGLGFQQAGDLAQAERLYRQVLQAQPNHARALHLLGTIALQVNKHEIAVQLLSAAIRADGGQAVCHAALGDALRARGQTRDAIASYRQALRLNPDYALVHNSLGAVLQTEGQSAEAAAHYRDAMRLDPSGAAAFFNLGALLQGEGQLEESVGPLSEAVRLAPDHGEFPLQLGKSYFHLGRLDEAVAQFEAATRARPTLTEAHFDLGIVLQTRGQLDRAIGAYRRAIELEPENVEAHTNLGTVLQAVGRPIEALACYHEAIRRKPTYTNAFLNLAVCHESLHQPDQAVAAARAAIALEPNSPAGYAHLGNSLRKQGETAEAIAAFRRVIELDPTDAGQHSNLLYALNTRADVDQTTLFAEHRAWAARHAEPLTAVARPHANDRSGDRRLRVGYVSAHFFSHAVSYFSEPMITAHDRQRVEVFCYSDVRTADEVTARFQAAADVWRDVAGLSNEALANQVRQDKIDILVDLAGHIGGNRLLTFARRPAPVQVTYLGYQNTTGMSAMDYRLTDDWSDPPGTTDAYYTERLVRLPRSFFCYRPSDFAPSVGDLPAATAGRVTFAALNHVNKLTDEALAAWARILSSVPDSRLIVLGYSPGQLERKVWDLMQHAGVDRSRVEVINRLSHVDYLRRYLTVDLALDSFPFNGHTTICDALWMGVPSIVLSGDRYAWRFGGTALANVGLSDLITNSVEEYVRAAIVLAGDSQRLIQMRLELRDRMRDSALLDFAGFARHVERAYREMWHRWCADGD